MKFILSSLKESPVSFLRRAGYAPHRDRHAVQPSFVRRLGVGEYPRFHLYAEQGAGGAVVFNLHLDQKRPSYEGSHAHAGEYEGPLIETETARLRAL